MANAYLRVSLFVKNCPVSIIESESTVMVARLVDNELWYYGLYDTWERAKEVAKELENGVVFEIDNENIKADMLAMLTELLLEIEQCGVEDSHWIIQEKINKLKGEEDGNKND